MQNKAGFIVSFIIGFLVVGGLFLLFTGDNNTYPEPYTVEPVLPTSTVSEPVAAQGTSEDVALFKDSFMDECVAEPEYYNYCNCTYNELVSNYTWKELIIMNGKVTENYMPEELVDAMSVCIDRLE